MKKGLRLMILFVLFLISGIFFVRENRNRFSNFLNSKETAPTTPATGEEKKLKDSIAYLKAKNWPASEIEIVETVRTTPGFTSFVVSYYSGELKQYALMNVPRAGKDRYPVIILNHGYINPEVYSTTQSYINTAASYANAGFLVLKPDYRGHAQSETDDSPLSRLAYAEDVLSLLASLDNLAPADTENVFMYGHSMGGDVTLRVIEADDRVKAVSLWAPVARDFPESILYFTRRHRPDNQIEEAEQEITANFDPKDYQFFSPLNYLQEINTKIIVHHGTDDQSVPYSWSENLVGRLEETGKNVKFYTYQGDNHNLSNNFSTVLSRDISFFKENLN